MRIAGIHHGRFPQIGMLNHRFQPHVRHLMVTLDVEEEFPSTSRDFLSLYHALVRVFPMLSRHQCCEQWENTPLFLQEIEGVSLKTVGEIADIAHLTEHLIVDLIVAITGVRLCSGITCGHREPETRFDLFVECEDVRAGVFAANFAVYLMRRLCARSRLSLRHRNVVEAARWLYTHPDDAHPAATISAGLGYSPGTTRMVINCLRVFQFFKREECR
jgi:hypothetical protein